MTRLYRFYNMEVSKHGEPFPLCDAHAKTQKIPHLCYLEKIADAARECVACSEEIEETKK